jgi:mono/diheme cytochrome c family protein
MAQQRPGEPGDPLAGARLFETKGCVQCHAVGGKGGTDGPDLSRLRGARSLYELTAAMWNHIPLMAPRIRASSAPRPYLTSREMADVVAFLRDAGSPEAAGDAERGRQVVAAKGCLACHPLAPEPGRAARSLGRLRGLDSPWTVMAAMWNHAFLMDLVAADRTLPWPRLSAEEMADLVAFLRAHALGGRERR